MILNVPTSPAIGRASRMSRICRSIETTPSGEDRPCILHTFDLHSELCAYVCFKMAIVFSFKRLVIDYPKFVHVMVESPVIASS